MARLLVRIQLRPFWPYSSAGRALKVVFTLLVAQFFADVAQRLECDLAKVDVEGSNPFIRLGGKMADFCQQCSFELFGDDFKELAGLSTEEDTKNGLYPVVICEGCGYIQVDHEGKCVSEDCLSRHSKPDYKLQKAEKPTEDQLSCSTCSTNGQCCEDGRCATEKKPSGEIESF